MKTPDKALDIVASLMFEVGKGKGNLTSHQVDGLVTIHGPFPPAVLKRVSNLLDEKKASTFFASLRAGIDRQNRHDSTGDYVTRSAIMVDG